jgi:hypothetical protein
MCYEIVPTVVNRQISVLTEEPSELFESINYVLKY